MRKAYPYGKRAKAGVYIMIAGEGLLFEVTTPLGFTVSVSAKYWDMIVTIKHPVMKGRGQDVQETLKHPDEIRRSKSD